MKTVLGLVGSSMSRRRFMSVSAVMLSFACIMLLGLAFSQGIFNVEVHTTPNGSGNGTITVPNPKYNGTAQILEKTSETIPCYNCGGTGKVSVLRALEMAVTSETFTWEFGNVSMTVKGVFRNDYDQAVKATVAARVDLTSMGTDLAYNQSAQEYFPAHQNTTVAISLNQMQTPDMWQPTWYNYNIYVLSSEGNIADKLIPCPVCNGTGLRTVEINHLISNPEYNATQWITQTGQNGATGPGYATDWLKVGMASGIGFVVSLGTLAFIGMRKKIKPGSLAET